jgi:hypothetical protein
LPAPVGGLDDLPTLPVLTKAEVARAGTDFFSRHATPTIVNTTSGTTGHPLVYYRCREELDASRTILERALGAADPAHAPLTLQLLHVAHGPHCLTAPEPDRVFFHSGSRAAFDELMSVLERPYWLGGRERKIEKVLIHVNELKRFTEYYEDQGRSFRHLGIRGIVAVANYISPALRDWVEDRWGAPLTTAYGLSEVAGSPCLEVGARSVYQFSPMVIPELVDPLDHSPPADGPGLLLLTSLYPFSQMTNFIRYSTGDLFEVAGCSDDGEPIYRFLGRRQHSIVRAGASGKTEYLLCSARLVDFLDRQPSVRRSWDDGLFSVSLARRTGYNHVRCRLDEPSSTLRIEVELLPPAAGAAGLERDLRDWLVDRHPDLRPALAAGLRLEIQAGTAAVPAMPA